MYEFQSLLLEAVLCAIVATFVLARSLGVVQAAVVASVKLAIPVVYFLAYGYETWALHDDIEYFRGALQLSSDAKWTPLTIFFNRDGYELLFSVARGDHIVYFWWNYLCNWMFGEFYWSPVLVNVAFTCIAAVFFGKILSLAGHSGRYVKLAIYFFLFFPELLVWSSFLNLKDSAMLMLTVVCSYGVASIIRGQAIVRSLLVIALSTVILIYLRFYIPLLFLCATAAWLMLASRGRVKFQLLLLPAVPIAY